VISHNWYSLTPTATVKYQWDAHSNAYFTYTQGFKSGGLGAVPLQENSGYAFAPEKVTAYELGVKTLVSDWLSLDASSFYYDYKNQQVFAFTTLCLPSGVCGTNAYVQNAAASRIYGLELAATAQLTEEFSITGGLSLLHATFTSFPNSADDMPFPPASCSPNPYPCGNGVMTENDTGKTLPRSPKWTLSLQPNYEHRFEAGMLDLNLSWFHSARVYFDNHDRVSQAPYDLLNARASWQPAGSPFGIALWARNLSDAVVYNSVFVNSFGDGASYLPPRTYGVTLDYKF